QITDNDTELLVELTDAGWARDIDFGDITSDDVEPYEQHAFSRQRRPDLPDEPAITIVERPTHTLGASGEIAAVIVGGRNASQGIRHGFTIDHEDPRVAGIDDVRNVTLHYGKPLAVPGQCFEHHRGVFIIVL